MGTVLEPVDYARVLESCDPETGKPPALIRVGMRVEEIQSLLGPPLEEFEEAQGTTLNYEVIRVQVRDGRVNEIMIPGID